MADRYFRLTDVSQQLRVSYAAPHRAVIAGQVPATRTPSGGRWQIHEEDLPTAAAVMGCDPWPFMGDNGSGCDNDGGLLQ